MWRWSAELRENRSNYGRHGAVKGDARVATQLSSPLGECRLAAGYTQESLAEKLGVDRCTVGRWERGMQSPQPWQRSELAAALGIGLAKLDDLLRRTIQLRQLGALRDDEAGQAADVDTGQPSAPGPPTAFDAAGDDSAIPGRPIGLDLDCTGEMSLVLPAATILVPAWVGGRGRVVYVAADRQRFHEEAGAALCGVGLPDALPRAASREPPAGISTGAADFFLSPRDAARVIVEWTAYDMATRRVVLVGLSLLSGTPLIQEIQRWAMTMPPTVPVRSGQVGTDEIYGLEQAVTSFRRWDATGNGGLHRKAVVGQLNAVAETLDDHHSPEATRRLFQVAAELAQVIGWMTYDTGSFELAQRYYLMALGACQHAGAVELGAKIVGDMTRLSTALGHYDDSLALVHRALATLPRGSNPLVRSELLGLEARAYAQFGSSETSNARRSIDACIETFGTATDADRADWIHYMNRATAEKKAADAYIELALREDESKRMGIHADHAETHLRQAIECRNAQYTRTRILDKIQLSVVRLAQEEPVEAVSIARGALQQAENIRSSMVLKGLTAFCGLLTDRYGDVAAAGGFRRDLYDYAQRVSPGNDGAILAQSSG